MPGETPENFGHGQTLAADAKKHGQRFNLANGPLLAMGWTPAFLGYPECAKAALGGVINACPVN